MKWIAYHGKQEIKDKYLARVRAHREADELVKGKYWEGGKGCAVGCTIHGSRHANYETELGIPAALARIEDGIFEGLSNADAQAWPEAFLDAITPGAELEPVKDLFIHWLLVDPTDGVIKYAKTENSKAAIQAVGDLYARKIGGEKITDSEWAKARNAAAYADAYAAAYAAYAAAYADAAYAAAAYAAAAYADAAYARTKSRKRQSEKLIELLQAAK